MAEVTSTPTSSSSSEGGFRSLHGGCICEKVRYEVNTPLISNWLCHCLSCRKCSGSLFMANSFVSSKAFRITKGKESLKSYSDSKTSSGNELFAFFCQNCSCLIYTDSEEMQREGGLTIPSGTLDDPIDWKPESEFWCKRRSPWLPHFGTAAKKMYNENPS